MNGVTGTGTWRAVWLRSITATADELEALVLLSPDQFLRLRVPKGADVAWERHVGKRVWLDPDRRLLRTDMPGSFNGRRPG